MSLDWSNVKALSIPVGGVARDVKAVSIGGVEVWRKPNPLPYDAEVEYIESNGTQYITLPNITITQTTTIRLGVTVPNSSNQNFFGQYNKAIAGVFNGVWRYQAASTWVQTNVSASTNPTVEWECGYSNGSRILRNGSVLWSNSSRTPGTGNSSMALFAIRNAQGGIETGKCACRYLLILDGDNETHSFWPVRVGSGSSAVGYLYDRANPTGGPLGNGLYPNSGSGAFGLGPDKTT